MYTSNSRTHTQNCDSNVIFFIRFFIKVNQENSRIKTSKTSLNNWTTSTRYDNASCRIRHSRPRRSIWVICLLGWTGAYHPIAEDVPGMSLWDMKWQWANYLRGRHHILIFCETKWPVELTGLGVSFEGGCLFVAQERPHAACVMLGHTGPGQVRASKIYTAAAQTFSIRLFGRK